MKIRSIVHYVCLGLLAETFLLAQGPEQEIVFQNPSAAFRGGVGRSQPVVDLPTKVAAPEGKISLWADFAAADEKGVPLYVVNQTDEPRLFSGQDGDIYVKLEFKDAAGAWKRAQAHLSSFCGNSYFPVKLPPRHFFAFRGYQPASGTKHLVRYKVHRDELASNEAEGVVAEADIKAAALDSLASGEIPNFIWNALRTNAGELLSPMPSLQQRAEALRALVWFPRNERAIMRVREFKTNVLSQVAESNDRNKLVQAIDEYLAKVDSPKPSPEKLVQMCIARVSDDPSADASMSKDTAWLLLASSPHDTTLSAIASKLAPAQWRPAIAPAVAMMIDRKEKTQGGGADAVLSSEQIVDTLVKDDELERWLAQTSSKRLQFLGAEALVRRSRARIVVDFAWKQTGPVQLTLLSALAFTRSSADGWRRAVRQANFEDDEHLFWEHCAKTMPVETANVLWTYEYAGGRSPFNRLIHDPLRDHFKAEAVRSPVEVEVSQADARPLQTALQMLASWQLEEDDDVMTALLKNGTYIKQEVLRGGDGPYVRVISKRFIYRGIAKEALMKRGQPVPADVVLESVISSVPEKSTR